MTETPSTTGRLRVGVLAGCDRTGPHAPHRGTSSATVDGTWYWVGWLCNGKTEPVQDLNGNQVEAARAAAGPEVSQTFITQASAPLDPRTHAFLGGPEEVVVEMLAYTDPKPVLDSNSNQGEALRGIASLLIRQDMRNADPVESRGTNDQKIMQWAVDTAGHLFDQHELWDYDMVSDADHVHRCYDHRHDGPGTRGLDRG